MRMMECHACESGWVYVVDDEGEEVQEKCENCGGTGRIPDDTPDESELGHG